MATAYATENKYSSPVRDGAEHGCDYNQLAKRYNQETKLVGKQVRVKQVSELPFLMGC